MARRQMIAEAVRAPLTLSNKKLSSSAGAPSNKAGGNSPHATVSVGSNPCTCWKPQRLKGAAIQFAQVTRVSGGAGKPCISPSSAAVLGNPSFSAA